MPTHEDLQDTIENLKEETAFLSKELNTVESEIDVVRELMSALQAENFKLQENLNKEITDGKKLYKIYHKLVWTCKEIEWERRIIARSWKRRLGDRALYYRGVALTYVGLVRGYFSTWAHQYYHGPSLGLIWNYRPDESYEDHVMALHYPGGVVLEEECAMSVVNKETTNVDASHKEKQKKNKSSVK
ncbi:hypothetical protein OSB04_011801 [Centaurea solstitialis]|uniref:Uncharacterized protein n=1 Tax=Centaurea solstitialis TaxID=347529 RepID=A0AA38TT86_9ASTR|nr:hypothetical protein OSB04_011801 [Centaurea solstitialis]